MRKILRIVLLITNIIAFAFVLLFGATGVIYETLGPAGYEKMLNKFKIPWGFEHIWLFMFACLTVLIITYFLRKKFIGR